MHEIQSPARTEQSPPRADVMLETLRSIGYDFETAVADIIDNSISAGASCINITCTWRGRQSTITIEDDGRGMNASEISEAMRLGSRHPSMERDITDLGRYGLGLKTASLSQCRKFTVISKADGQNLESRCWSLDHVAEVQQWETLCDAPTWFDITHAASKKSGTWVVWEDLDRITAGMSHDRQTDELIWAAYLSVLRDHLSVVFHRYLEDGLSITVNSLALKPWDPFLSGVKGTQSFPDEWLDGGRILTRTFILPQKDFLTDEQFRKAGGIKGWNAQQGFYIYRNKRLLVAGGWVDGLKLEEHCKLARVLIDLPNTLDFDWQIDIRKAQSRPPEPLKKELKRIATAARSKAIEVYSVRGKVIQRTSKVGFIPVWNYRIRQGRHSYTINREHPSLEHFKSLLSDVPEGSKQLTALLKLIEEAIPVALITIKEAEEPERTHVPFDGDDSAVKPMFDMIVAAKQRAGDSPDVIKGFMLNCEPFNRFPHLIASIN